MAKLTCIQEVKRLNMEYMEDIITLQEYKKEVQAIVNEVPEELKIKVANEALFVSLSVH